MRDLGLEWEQKYMQHMEDHHPGGQEHIGSAGRPHG